MARYHPALDVAGADPDLVLALVDDFSPTALEARDSAVRVFFGTSDGRDAAHAALAGRFDVASVEVSDEDWARRSQENLRPVTVGRITVIPAPHIRIPSAEIAIVIQPSMGFGTGHHATTRLCLEALQHLDIVGKRVLDVGTGSGILAIAARRLGAAEALGIDIDADAIEAARDNLTLNPDATQVGFEAGDVGDAPPDRFDIVLANLTGGLIVRASARLSSAIAAGGVLIVSGLLSHERDDLVHELPRLDVVWEREEDSWVGIAMKKP